MQCSQQIMQKLPQILLNSAHGINRTGRYQMCLSEQAMKYSWISFHQLVDKKDTYFNIGLCIPQTCSQKDIKDTIQSILDLFDIQLSVVNIQIFSKDNQDSLNVISYITLAIIAVFILLCLISTLFHYIGYFNPKNPLVNFSLSSSFSYFKHKNSTLNVFNGLKTLLMFWIILGHEYFFHLSVANNMLTFNHVLLSPFMLIIEAGMMAVDGFLFLGGFFIAKVILETNVCDIRGAAVLIIGRILRFWPVYIVTLLIFYSLLPYMGSGPYWSAITSQTELCNHWWRSLFFLDNLIDNGKYICMSWSWYLQLDIQLFICTLPILVFSKNYRKIGSIILIIILIASLCFTMYMNYSHNFKQAIHLQDFGPQDTSFTDVYIKPWCRCPSYIIGILFAFYYLKHTENYKLNRQANTMKLNTSQTELRNQSDQMRKGTVFDSKAVRWVVQLLGLSILLFLIFIPRTSQLGNLWSRTSNSIYLTFSKPLFCISLTLLTLPSLLGYSTFLSTILDNKLTTTVSKLSFSVYLIHLLIIMPFSYNTKSEFYYNHSTLIVLVFAHTAISSIFAFFIVVFIEVPMGGIVRRVLKGFGVGKK